MRSPFNKYYKAYRAARKAAGRPDLRPHDLRHSLPFQIIFSGGTLSDVQAALHHKSVIASNRYAHLYPEWVERAISRPQKCPPRALIRSRKTGRRWRKPFKLVPGAGVEPARRNYPSRDFKSLVSTSFTTRARGGDCVRKKLGAVALESGWRRGSESNRRPRLCRPLHDHSATPPHALRLKRSSDGLQARAVPRNSGAGDESRTRDLNLGKVTLYQLSYSRESRRKFYGPIPLRSSRRRSPSARGATASFR